MVTYTDDQFCPICVTFITHLNYILCLVNDILNVKFTTAIPYSNYNYILTASSRLFTIRSVQRANVAASQNVGREFGSRLSYSD